MQNAIRIFSTGVSVKEACKRSGVGPRYFKRVMLAPIGADYFKTITVRTEEAFIDKAAAVAASEQKLTVGQATVQNEIDEAVLESVQELRSIVKTSKSDQARALAAKELLDLAQAKKRYMAAKGSQESDVELSAADIAIFSQAAADLRSLHMTGTLEVAGEELKPDEASIVRTIEAAVDPSAIEAAERAIDQVSVVDIAATTEAENARPSSFAGNSNDESRQDARPDGRIADPLQSTATEPEEPQP